MTYLNVVALSKATTSLKRLMDQATLLDYRMLWGSEEKQHSAMELALLTEDEQAVMTLSLPRQDAIQA